MPTRLFWLLLLIAGSAAAQQRPAIYCSGTTRTSHPMAKNPYVRRFKGRYFLGYFIPPNAQFGR